MKNVSFIIFLVAVFFSTGLAQSPQFTPYQRPNAEKRFKRYMNDAVGPYALAAVAAGAGFSTAKNSPEEWEGNARGFGKRLASNFGKNLIRSTVKYSLDEALKLDSQYYRSEKKGVGTRFGHALLSTVTARRANGKRTVGVPRIVGTYTAHIVAAEAWFPARYDWKDGVRSGTISLGTNAIVNLVREFVFK